MWRSRMEGRIWVSGFEVGALALVGALATGAALEAQAVAVRRAVDTPIEVRTEDVYTIGSADADEWEAFTLVERNDIGFDRAGNLYILDEGGRRLLKVDPRGAFVSETSAVGDGPGEFRRPTAIAVHPDGSVTVFDVGRQALIFLGPEGQLLEHRSLTVEELPGGSLMSDGRGGVYSGSGQGVRVVTPNSTSRPASGVPIRRYGPPGQPTIEEVHRAWAPRSPGLGIVAFQPEFSMAVDPSPDGLIFVSDTASYRVRAISPGGSVREIVRPIAPVTVDAAMRTRERERRLQELDRGEGPRFRLNVGGASEEVSRRLAERQRRRIEEMEFAEVVPVIRRIGWDRGGCLWVQRTGSAVDEPGPIDLFRALDGSYVGTVDDVGLELPFAFGPDGLMARIELDALDVPTVRVLRAQIDECAGQEESGPTQQGSVLR